MTAQPNIVLIITDQQRFDTINALGAPWMHTPNIDRLVREGMSFTNCFVTSPVCVASRASMFRGVYPHSTNVYTNFEPWEPNWVSWLADAGYHCVNIGKMHINPYDAKGGFHQRFMVENKDRPLFLEEHDRAIYDEWDKALKARGLVKPSRYTRVEADPKGFLDALGCFIWETDDDMHPDNFVGNTARWWLEDRKAESPFFLQIGFPGPHPPYDPTAEHFKRYENADIPVPDVSATELARQPGMHKRLRQSMIDFNIDSVAWREDAPQEDLLKLRRYYAANVTMIDEKVGEIMEALRQKNYLDNTIVIFCSDHADALGDHGHIQKWTMYDTVVRVPMVVWSPGQVKTGVSDELVQLMDVSPSILEACGVTHPDNWEAKSLGPILREGRSPDGRFRDYVYAELGRDHIQSASEFVIMRRNHDWKEVLYVGSDEGELYDLQADPDETNNLWSEPAHRERRDAATRDILAWSTLGAYRANRPKMRQAQSPMTVKS
jgi:arylsulfatase